MAVRKLERPNPSALFVLALIQMEESEPLPVFLQYGVVVLAGSK